MFKGNRFLQSGLKKLLVVSFAILLGLTVLGAKDVQAESASGTVNAVGVELPDEYKEVKLELIDDGGIPTYTGSYDKMGPSDGIDMAKGVKYTTKYKTVYYGIPLTVETSATLTSDIATSSSRYCKVYLYNNDMLMVAWLDVNNATVDWDIKIYDENGVSYMQYFLFGFVDPDESNYTFDSRGRDVYFQDAKAGDGSSWTAASYYNFVNGKDGGFYRKTDTVVPFYDAIFAVSLLDEEVFSFTSTTRVGGSMFIPFLYTLGYDITYELNDTPGTPATPAEGNPTMYGESPRDVKIENNPSRTGYDFLGWYEVYGPDSVSENPVTTIPAGSTGDKVFRAYWKPHKYHVAFNTNVPKGTPNVAEGTEATGTTDNQPDRTFDEPYTLSANGFALTGYKFKGWSLKEGEQPVDYNDQASYTNLTDVDDATVDLYAQWDPIEYLIKYNANKPTDAPEPTGEMADDDHRKYDIGYNLTENAFAIEGYDFLGWSTVEGVHDVEYENKAAYKNLVNTDGTIVTMYAQWKPWTYTIKYDPNGGVGTMPVQTFYNKDTTMPSLKNAFTRDGYKFAGFDYEYKGVKYHLNGTDDFVEKLKVLGHYGEVILVAQWEKLPDPVVAVYRLPVTGVE